MRLFQIDRHLHVLYRVDVIVWRNKLRCRQVLPFIMRQIKCLPEALELLPVAALEFSIVYKGQDILLVDGGC